MSPRVRSPDSLRLRAPPRPPPWLGPQTRAEAPTDSSSKISQANETAAFACRGGGGDRAGSRSNARPCPPSHPAAQPWTPSDVRAQHLGASTVDRPRLALCRPASQATTQPGPPPTLPWASNLTTYQCGNGFRPTRPDHLTPEALHGDRTGLGH
ncbi:hypothetical protein PAL_GLEAN10011206 [Pteropus alecto]|uniref:Uncharacterized protein n=1 Tax=Pteropus alecto TaxID=9402 RepID=L5KPS8_PTEAL|nr:hypothetical protein PAL_GLEAN10011206 [Pteropus alecto]